MHISPVNDHACIAFAPFRLAILTDLHLSEGRGMEKFRWAVERINSSRDIEMVLILGDFIWEGDLHELRALLGTIRKPCHFVLGNNDRNRVSEYEQEFGALYHSFIFRQCLFVGLWNALQLGDMGDHQGDMDAAQIDWLERTLCDARNAQPVYQHLFLFAHVPMKRDWTIPDKYWLLPEISRKWVQWCDEFGVTACFFGHTHWRDVFRIGRTQFITTPSLNWNFDCEDTRVQPYWLRARRPYSSFEIVSVGAADITHRLHPVQLDDEAVNSAAELLHGGNASP